MKEYFLFLAIATIASATGCILNYIEEEKENDEACDDDGDQGKR